MRWYVLRIKGRRAEWLMSQIGEENCWIPWGYRWTKPARKHKRVLTKVSLIPGWLFVKESQLGKWEGLDGVHGTLKYGRLGTLWIEDDDLNGLRAVCGKPGAEPKDLPLTEGTKPVAWRPSVGDRVRVMGLLGGLEGVVVDSRGSHEYRIDAGNFPVWVDIRLLKPVKP